MPETAFAAFRFIEHLHGRPFHHFVACHHELRDALPVVHREGLVG